MSCGEVDATVPGCLWNLTSVLAGSPAQQRGLQKQGAAPRSTASPQGGSADGAWASAASQRLQPAPRTVIPPPVQWQSPPAYRPAQPTPSAPTKMVREWVLCRSQCQSEDLMMSCASFTSSVLSLAMCANQHCKGLQMIRDDCLCRLRWVSWRRP